MIRVGLEPGASLAQWREQARTLLQRGIAPERLSWVRGAQDDLLGSAPDEADPGTEPSLAVPAPRVPQGFPELADALIAHADAQAPALAYRLLWRLNHGDPSLLERVTDADVVRARHWEQAVHRDSHKMKAFVRFREIADDDGEPVYVAWFEPSNYIVERLAPFFVRRFTGMRWSILTPYRSAHWDGQVTRFGPGAQRGDAPRDDALEDLWRTYYASIFNPARLKVKAMTQQMPQKYWKNLPEARLIPGLVRRAAPRQEAMVEQTFSAPNLRIKWRETAVEPRPPGSLDALRAQAHACQRCPLWKPATQTVFGQGPADARLVVVGEQPGDQEDLAGRPFVGPAGQLLDQALQTVGLDRSTLYLTNAVKHFKFEPRGKRRLHRRADAAEQAACRTWLDAELDRIRPQRVLCLGSLAAEALMGRGFRLLQERGRWFERADGSRCLATVHPAYLLRLPDEAARAAAYQAFLADLRIVAQALASSP